MPLTQLGRALLVALPVLTFAGPAYAEAYAYPSPHAHDGRRVRGRVLTPEVRYRDPRYLPRRRVSGFAAAPTDLISSYLPRYTDRPMYNEPPRRFPQR